jgi:hypothetical protein
MGRTVEESCVLIDTITGRCVREPEFGLRVLDSPEEALAEYELNEGELEDFQMLAAHHREYALAHWDVLRKALEITRSQMAKKAQGK